MKMFKRIASSLGVLIFSLSSIELALFLREKKSHLPDVKISSERSDKVKFLVIGDSVLGKDTVAGSLSNQVKSYLQKNLRTEIQFINHTEPVMSSWQANENIDRYIEEDKPTAAIILLGLGTSDFTVFSDSEKTVGQNSLYNTLLKMRSMQLIDRLLIISERNENKRKAQRGAPLEKFAPPSATEKIANIKACLPEVNIKEKSADYIHSQVVACLKGNSIKLDSLAVWYFLSGLFEQKNLHEQAIVSLTKCLSEPSRFPLVANRILWQHFLNHNFEKMFDVFEEMIKSGTPTRQLMFLARKTYILQNEIPRGISAFSSFEKSSQPAYLKHFAALLGDGLKMIAGSNNSVGHEEIKTYDDYITMLYSHKKLGQKDAANQLYRDINQFEIFEDNLPDAESLTQLIQKLQEAQVVTFVVQYPNLPTWPIKKVTDHFKNSVYLISLQENVLPQLSTYVIYDLLEEDLLHPSELGAEVFGQIISKNILSQIDQLKGEKNERY